MNRAAVPKPNPSPPAAQTRPIRVRGHRAGHLVGWTGDGSPLVDCPGNPHGPLPARTLESKPEVRAPGDQQEVLLTFESERSDRPIVVGFLTPSTIAALSSDSAEAPESGKSLEAVVDGKRVVIEGEDEIVLKCGLASVTLRRNGRVVIRGTYVETRANGVNRIRGGTVEIN